MSNLGILLKIQFLSILKSTSQTSNRKKVAGLGTLFILGAAFLYMSIVYTFSMVATFPEGYKHITLYVMGIMTISMLLIFGYQSAGGHLFGFKDYDLLMSLPVTKEEILLSKFLTFLFLEYFYAFFLLIPAIIIVGITCQFGISYYLLGMITWFLVPIIPMVIASVLAYFAMKLASQFKYKNLMNNIFYVILMGFVFILIFGYQELLNGNITQLENIMDNMRKYLPFIAYMFNGMVFNQFGQFMIGCLLNIFVFVLFIIIFSKTFMKLNGQIKSGYKNKNFKLTQSKSNSVYLALLKKECRTYFSYSIYFMNTAIMPIITIGGFAYACIFMRNDLQMIVNMFDDVLLIILCGTIFTITLMTCTTNSSISIEGANFELLKSYPIDPKDIFLSKISVNLLVVLPFGILGAILAYIFLGISIFEVLLMVITTFTSGYFISAFGLILNLHFYRFDWDNVAIIVKQSLPVFITMIGGMVVGGGAIGLGFLLVEYLDPILLIFILNVLLLAIDLILYLYLNKKGIEQFYKIH